MKAYKGFDRNMRCRGFQFEEGKTYEEDKAELCKTGFHACTNPLDVWWYYPPTDGCEYHEVELEEVKEERNNADSKVCGKRIRIGAKLGIEGIVNAFVSMCTKKTTGGKNAQSALIDNGKNFEQIGSSEDWARIASSGDRACIASSGEWASIGSSGYETRIGSSGNRACVGLSGNRACIGSSGYRACIGSSGNEAQIGSSGNGVRIASSGDGARITSSGDGAQIASSGDGTQIKTLRPNCVMMCAGRVNRAKGKIGSWIVLTEWINGEPNVVAKRIDGTSIKADVWYTLKGGQLQEVGTDE